MDANPYKSPEADLDEPLPPHEQVDPTGLRFARAAARSGLVIDGLRFVSDALHYAPRLIAGATPGQHLRGWALCEAVARYAQEQFGGEAADVLSQWELVTGEDVGSVVGALLKEGLMQASAEDSAADFAGLGSLADMISSSEHRGPQHAMNRNRYQSSRAAPTIDAAGKEVAQSPLMIALILLSFAAVMFFLGMLLGVGRGW